MDVHAEIAELAGPFQDGTLPEEVDREVAAHLEVCAECVAHFQVLEAEPEPPEVEPFWRRPAVRRLARVLIAGGSVAGLTLAGTFFQDGLPAFPTAAAEGATEAVALSMPRMARSAVPDLAPNEKSLDADEAAFIGRGSSGRAFGDGGGHGLRRGGGAGATGSAAPADVFEAEAKLIRHAEMDLEAESFATTRTRVSEILAQEKGLLSAAETRRLPNGKSSGTLTLRVPPERFEAVLDRLRELGTVRHQNVQSRDVTRAYRDLESRLAAKQALMERLRAVLAEAKGTVKDLMEVEVQMGRTVEELEALKGELKYYDNVVGYSTIVLKLSERDLGQPAEVVETLRATLAVAVRDAETAYARAQDIVRGAGGQVTDAQLTRDGGGEVKALVRARVEAGKFPDVRQALRGLGHATQDAVDRRREAQGEAAGVDVPVRVEWAGVELRLATLAAQVTRRTSLALETRDVDPAYQAARQAFEEAGAAVTAGGLTAGADGASATLAGEMEVERAAALVARLSGLGTVKRSDTRHALPAAGPARERARLEIAIATPAPIVAEEHGLARTFRTTISGSVGGLLWSVERLVVGLFLAGPWAAVGLLGWLVVRRLRRKKPAEAPAAP